MAPRAFTFLEIMVVVVIMGVLIAVTGVRLKGTSERSALTGASRELLSACNVARQAAISTQRDVWIKFDVNNDRWRIDLNVDPEEEDRHAHYDRDARYDLESIHELPAKISFTQVTTAAGAYEKDKKDEFPLIVFHPDGSATGASVVLKSDKGRQMTVEVSAATGRPETYRGEPREFGEKLKAIGVDPSAFSGGDSGAGIGSEGALIDPNDPDAAAKAAAVGGNSKDTYYKGVLDRIMDARGFRKTSSESRYGR